ncbi:MAG: universal stress protein [Thaumarchaeota archaeon]|nr:universal stress protein [Nitrososphaerota archaeon]
MNGKYKNIMIPYDSSKHSQKALEMAVGMGAMFGSTLYLVNVVDLSTVSPPGWGLSQGTRKTISQITKSVKNTSELQLKKTQQKYSDSGVSMKEFVLEGHVVDKLLKFAQDKDIDLIIIGSRGLSGISKIMTLGSTSRKISELAKCPVTIVH